MIFAYFDNGDGLLGIWNKKVKKWTAQRLYLTDSGHYLLMISNFQRKADVSMSKALARTAAPVAKEGRLLKKDHECISLFSNQTTKHDFLVTCTSDVENAFLQQELYQDQHFR